MSYSFIEKKVWVTGASSGIGMALANKLLSAGAHVIVTARNESSLKSAFSRHPKALVLAGDITSKSVNQDIVNTAIQKLGGIDCVIFNAGSAEYIDIKNFTSEPFERMMDTNFLSMVRGIEAVLPVLRKSDSPYLVAMSSSVAWQGLPQGQAYSASKAAIRNLFQGLKIELASENIAVSWICPGFVKTPLTDKNTFDMPSRISVDDAADEILNGLYKQSTEIHFPKRFTLVLKFLSLFPAGIAAKLLKGTVPIK
jgi:NADP-dependent 3-hydroxy acid dehydrogenase YdfG